VKKSVCSWQASRKKKVKTMRDDSTLGNQILNALIPVGLAFLIGAVGILIAKQNPLTAYYVMISQSLFDLDGLMKTLHYAAPLILTGLAIAVSFKAKLFNMGVEGQLLVGGFVVSYAAYRLSFLPGPMLIPVLLGIGLLSGLLTALIPALLKAYYNVNELVVTLLLNYAIIEVLEYLTSNVFRDPSAGYVSTPMIGSAAVISRLFGTRLTMFFLVALIAFAIMYVVFKHSKLGYEIEAMGKNLEFSEAVGMGVRRKIITIMLISGSLAGLGGAGWMLSEKYAYTLNFSGSPGLGWDGMLIALLGSHSPVGVFIAAIFYAALKVGSNSIALYTDVPSEIVGLIQALIILFLSIRFIRNTGLLHSLTCRLQPSRIEKKKGEA